ncbi:MAG TPA: hypothetical protein VFW90_02460 [Candidatus Saccharimonadales bacterium]|nr:hypothetical protein [Candidatus Saccharimonadales bacterium]
MSQIESQSDRVNRHRKSIFELNGPEAALYFLIGIILIVVYNTGTIIGSMDNGYLAAAQSLKANFSTLGNGFSTSFSLALGGRLGQILLWAFIGGLCYIALWLAKNILNSFENDIISAHYLHPSAYSQVGYWGSSMAGKIFLAAAALIVITYIYLFVNVAMPSISAFAASAAYNFNGKTSPFYILASLIAGTVLIYIGVLLLRILVRLWRHL